MRQLFGPPATGGDTVRGNISEERTDGRAGYGGRSPVIGERREQRRSFISSIKASGYSGAMFKLVASRNCQEIV